MTTGGFKYYLKIVIIIGGDRMYVKKLDIDWVEDEAGEMVESATKVREMEDEVEDVIQSLEKNRRDYREGKISESTFKTNEKRFLADKNALSKNIREFAQEYLGCLANLRKLGTQHLVLKEKGISLQGAPAKIRTHAKSPALSKKSSKKGKGR